MAYHFISNEMWDVDMTNDKQRLLGLLGCKASQSHVGFQNRSAQKPDRNCFSRCCLTYVWRVIGFIIWFIQLSICSCQLQISAFYFPTFEKADCTIFALPVGRFVGVTINFPSPNCVTQPCTDLVPTRTIPTLFTWSSFLVPQVKLHACKLDTALQVDAGFWARMFSMLPISSPAQMDSTWIQS